MIDLVVGLVGVARIDARRSITITATTSRPLAKSERDHLLTIAGDVTTTHRAASESEITSAIVARLMGAHNRVIEVRVTIEAMP